VEFRIKLIFSLPILILTSTFVFGVKKRQASIVKKKTPVDFKSITKRTKEYIEIYCKFLKSLSDKPENDIHCHNNTLEQLLHNHFLADESFCEAKCDCLEKILHTIAEGRTKILKTLQNRVKKRYWLVAYLTFMRFFTENKHYTNYDIYPKKVPLLIATEIQKLHQKFVPILEMLKERNASLEKNKKKLFQNQKNKKYIDMQIICEE